MNDDQNDLFGTEPYKLYRPGDPDTSMDAAHQVDTTKLEGLVYQAISSFGSKGAISDEIRELYPRKPYSSITARYAALKEKGLIVTDEEKRPGWSGKEQHVMWAKTFYPKVAS